VAKLVVWLRMRQRDSLSLRRGLPPVSGGASLFSSSPRPRGSSSRSERGSEERAVCITKARGSWWCSRGRRRCWLHPCSAQAARCNSYSISMGNEPLGTATCKQPLVGGPPRPGRPAVHLYTKAYYARALSVPDRDGYLVFSPNLSNKRLRRASRQVKYQSVSGMNSR